MKFVTACFVVMFKILRMWGSWVNLWKVIYELGE